MSRHVAHDTVYIVSQSIVCAVNIGLLWHCMYNHMVALDLSSYVYCKMCKTGLKRWVKEREGGVEREREREREREGERQRER